MILAGSILKYSQRDDVAGIFGESYRSGGFTVLIEEEKAHLLDRTKCYIYYFDLKKKEFVYKVNHSIMVKDAQTLEWVI